MVETAGGQYGIVLIDDDEEIAPLVEALIDVDGRFALRGRATTAIDGIELAGDLQPDLVLLDLHLPGMDGLEAIPGLRRAARCPIVVFSNFPDPFTLMDVLRAGADAYVDKLRAWSDLVPTMVAVCELLSPGGALPTSSGRSR